MFQMLARKVIEYDLSHLDRSGFPSTVCRALLDIYGQRYGVRASYREIMYALFISSTPLLTHVCYQRVPHLVGKDDQFGD